MTGEKTEKYIISTKNLWWDITWKLWVDKNKN
jgi:hypothetical protein